jgi:carbamoyl-phosphate synthase large subunit
MKPIKVCITGVGGGGHGLQIVKALRKAQTPYHIVGADITKLSAGLELADAPCLLPLASDPAYINELLDLCRQHQIEALFHGSEAELQVMSQNREAIQKEGILLPINPRDVISLCLDKVKLSAALIEMGIQVPRFIRIGDTDDLASLPEYPSIFKPSVGSGGSANTFIVQNDKEAEMFAKYLLDLYPEFIAQEYVGTPNDEYTVGILSDMDGEFINSIAVRRHVLSALSSRTRLPNRTGRDELGPELVISSGISQGEIGAFPEVTGRCEEIARLLGSRGALNIQCRLVNGQVSIFEINPRFSGTTSLRALAGFNEPDILIRRHILNEEIEPRFAIKPGVILRRLEEVFVE